MAIAAILIPVHNRENLIGRTIEAAINQTVTDIEIIIVDNQSTDSTFDICCKFAEIDKRIKNFRNEVNIGPVRNWIKCTEYTTAPFAKILFSDDLIFPNYLERTLPYILSPECALVYTPAIIGSEDWKGVIHYNAFINDCTIMRDYFIRVATHIANFTPVSPGAALFRTSDLRKHILTSLPGLDGYDFAYYGAGVDWLIYTLTAMCYTHVAYVSDPLVYFHAHEGSITISNENNMVPMGYTIAKKWFMAVFGNDSI